MNTTFFPMPFSAIYCDVFNCRNMSKWFIGRADGPLGNTFKLCDDCAKHMLSNLPESLVEAALNQVIPEPIVIEEPAAVQAPEPEPIAEPEPEPIVVEAAPKPEPPSTAIYRCLDCNAEFTDNRGLSNHKRSKHKE